MADNTKGYKIYDLAKELNTNSKRIMEKLAEINIDVKSHMSFLTEEQKDALYNHIGVIQRKADSSDTQQDKPLPPPPKNDRRPAPATRVPSGPRIIKKTQINLDFTDRSPDKDIKRPPLKSADNFTRKRSEHITLADDNSGLRAGFKRDTGYSQRPLRERFNRDATAKTETEEKKPATAAGQSASGKITATGFANEAITAKEEEITKIKTTAAEVTAMPEAASDRQNEEITAIEALEKQDKKSKTTRPDEKSIDVPASPGITDAKSEKASEKPGGEQAQAVTADSKKSEKGQITEPGVPADKLHEQHAGVTDDKIRTGTKMSDEEQHEAKPAGLPSEEVKAGSSPSVEKSGEKRGASAWSKPGFSSTSSKPSGSTAWTKPTGQSTWTKPTGLSSSGERHTGASTWTKPAGSSYSGDRHTGPSTTGTRPAGTWSEKSGRPAYKSGQDSRPGGYAGSGRTGGSDRPWTPSAGTGRPTAGGSKPPFGKRPSSTSKPGFPDTPIVGKETARPDKRLRNQKDSARVETVAEKRAQIKPGTDELNKFKPQNIVLGGKTKVGDVMTEEFEFGVFYQEFGKKKKAPRRRDGMEARPNTPKPVILTIKVPDTIIVKDLAEKMKKSVGDLIKKLMTMGMMVTINQEIDFDTASILGDEFKVKVEKEVIVSDEEILFDDDTLIDKEEDLQPRAPVVVVMGHVDHGKTSLLDAIREENVIATEAGGITQHIGAYKVKINDRDITFLDTPGHEAFTSLRARGAQVTDIAILVVAADDGVMPQTIEAVNHAKAANVQIIVAINKMDLPGANPERIKQQLTEYGLLSEEWGGNTIFVPISAKKKENIDQLLEMVLLTADMLELKTNPNRQAKGTVIETQLDKNRGAIATLLVQRGTLKVGDSIVTGTTVGHVRAMLSDTGREITEAGPSTPVAILGLPEVPDAGQLFYAIKDEKVAKHLAERRKNEAKEAQYKSTVRVTLDDLYNQIKEGTVKDLNLIIRADVQGSAEALKQSLEKLGNSEVKVKILHSGVGAISESDVSLAEVANAIIIGFNVRPSSNVREIAEAAKVDIRLYRIIYNAIDDIEAALKGMLAVKYKEVVLGHAEVRQIFKVTGVGAIAGCYVTDGKVPRSSEVRLVRDGIVIHEGKLSSLKRFKDDVKEVVQGFECGMSFEKYNDLKEGDVIEAFDMEEVKR